MQPFYTASGVFVALEGGEGAGKSTQSVMLETSLSDLGHDVTLTREPGGTSLGSELRRILLSHETGNISPRAEALVYAADKAEHVESLVLPALEDGKIVITDRYVDSTLAYQGSGRSLDPDELEHVARWATKSLRPHMSVLLDVAPTLGLGRFDDRDRMEREPLDFHDRVRKRFLELAANDPEHYLVVDARADREEIHRDIMKRLEPWLRQAGTVR